MACADCEKLQYIVLLVPFCLAIFGLTIITVYCHFTFNIVELTMQYVMGMRVILLLTIINPCKFGQSDLAQFLPRYKVVDLKTQC
jgi:hypothetical protein